jgi:hypothetical protein
VGWGAGVGVVVVQGNAAERSRACGCTGAACANTHAAAGHRCTPWASCWQADARAHLPPGLVVPAGAGLHHVVAGLGVGLHAELGGAVGAAVVEAEDLRGSGGEVSQRGRSSGAGATHGVTPAAGGGWGLQHAPAAGARGAESVVTRATHTRTLSPRYSSPSTSSLRVLNLVPLYMNVPHVLQRTLMGNIMRTCTMRVRTCVCGGVAMRVRRGPKHAACGGKRCAVCVVLGLLYTQPRTHCAEHNAAQHCGNAAAALCAQPRLTHTFISLFCCRLPRGSFAGSKSGG